MECPQTRLFWSLVLLIFAVTTSKADGDCNAKGSFPKPAVHAGFRLLPPLTECGNSLRPDRIVGGESPSIIEFPWLVRIGYISHFEDDEIKYLCAGTIINKRYILTAAHCTQEINPEEYEPSVIRLATKDETCEDVYGCSEPIDIKIKKIIPHPNYNKKTKENDIGLIRLDEDIPFEVKINKIFMRPVCLPFAEEYGLTKAELDPNLQKVIDSKKPSEWAQVAGWGKTHWNKNEGSEFLQEIRLPVISRDQCQKNYESHTHVNISEKQYCVGGEVGKDSCGGDSGGGFYITHILRLNAKQRIVKTFQYGVVSFGPMQCEVGDLPGVYSNVHAYKNWILDHLEP